MIDSDIEDIEKSYRNVINLFGGNEKQMIKWWTHYNHHLKGTPLELLSSKSGIAEVLKYTGGMMRH